MLYQLPNGKTIRISEEIFFNMDEDELNYLIASDTGYTVDDPFFESSIDSIIPELDNLPDVPDEPEEL